jgi:hypothetical protein
MKKLPALAMLRLLLTVLLIFPLSTLCSQFIQSLATTFGWDQSALGFVSPLVQRFAGMAHRLWFLLLSAVLFGAALAAWTAHILPKAVVWAHEDVKGEWSLSIQGVATLKNEKNIKRWFVLPIGVLEMADSQGNIVSRSSAGTILFLIYNELVAVRQFHLDIEGREPPLFEVKDNNAHGCVIVVTGNLNGCLLKLRIEV